MDGGTPENSRLELRLEPESSRYDSTDARWAHQVADLTLELQRTVGGVTQKSVPQPGQKGAAADVILALGASGAFGTFLATTRAWLARDRSRSLRVTWNVDGQENSVSISGASIDSEALRVLAEAAAERLGAAPSG